MKQNNFQIRDFLKTREAILVHFNTSMISRGIGYPGDLHKALAKTNMSLSCSTILVGDRGPFDPSLQAPQYANAVGGVGIVIDFQTNASVTEVLDEDSGASEAFGGGYRGCGDIPTEQSCEASIDRRTTHNEWVVKNYQPLGLFVFPETYVYRTIGVKYRGDYSIDRQTLLGDFPDLRLFSLSKTSFVEFDMATGAWTPISHQNIYP